MDNLIIDIISENYSCRSAYGLDQRGHQDGKVIAIAHADSVLDLASLQGQIGALVALRASRIVKVIPAALGHAVVDLANLVYAELTKIVGSHGHGSVGYER